MMSEETFYRDKSIEISRTMAKFGKTTYPIAGIGSVFVRAPQRSGAYTVAGGEQRL
jgi:hypothetical protein